MVFAVSILSVAQLLFLLSSRRPYSLFKHSTFGWAFMPMCLVHSKTVSAKIKISCYLMFYKMSVRQYLHFNQIFGCIECFEDLESHDRTNM